MRTDPAVASLRSSYLEALVRGDVRGARGLVDGAVGGGLDAREVYLGVLQPALYEIGRRWERAELSVAQEHLATAVTESLMASLAPRLIPAPAPAPRGRVVVACSAGELHRLGSRMVGDFLEADGWEVVYLGALTPPEDLAAMVAQQDARVLAISASLPDRLGEIEDACREVSRLDPRPVIIAGGQAFGGDEALARRLGVDLFAADAASAAEGLREL